MMFTLALVLALAADARNAPLKAAIQMHESGYDAPVSIKSARGGYWHADRDDSFQQPHTQINGEEQTYLQYTYPADSNDVCEGLDDANGCYAYGTLGGAYASRATKLLMGYWFDNSYTNSRGRRSVNTALAVIDPPCQVGSIRPATGECSSTLADKQNFATKFPDWNLQTMDCFDYAAYKASGKTQPEDFNPAFNKNNHFGVNVPGTTAGATDQLSIPGDIFNPSTWSDPNDQSPRIDDFVTYFSDVMEATLSGFDFPAFGTHDLPAAPNSGRRSETGPSSVGPEMLTTTQCGVLAEKLGWKRSSVVYRSDNTFCPLYCKMVAPESCTDYGCTVELSAGWLYDGSGSVTYAESSHARNARPSYFKINNAVANFGNGFCVKLREGIDVDETHKL